MTNEEKARILASGIDCEKKQRNEIRRAILKMAQWKDERLSKCLENLEKEYIRNSGKGLYDNNEIAAKLATLKRIEEEMK